MDEAKPAPPHSEAEHLNLLDIALVLAEYWRALIFFPLTAGVIALGIGFLIPPTYTATTRLLPPAQQQGASPALSMQLGALAGLVGNASALKNPADQYVALLKSRSVYDAIIHRFRLKDLYEASYLEDARNRLERRSRVSAGAKDGIITIEVEDRDPDRAAAMANAFVEELRRLTKTLAITEAAQRRLFFEEQLAQTKENLTKSEIALQGSGVSEATLRTVPQSALEALARLKAQISAQEIRLASMRSFMTDANPELKVGMQELAALRAELSKAEQSSPTKGGRKGVEYIAKYRDFKYHETLLELMAKQYELARLDEAREGAVIQVVDPALPPERKSSPKRVLLAVIAALGTFVLALLFAFTRRAFHAMAHQFESADKVRRLRQLLGLRIT
jgi:tyrosine-protein kinase Etk/Wzc